MHNVLAGAGTEPGCACQAVAHANEALTLWFASSSTFPPLPTVTIFPVPGKWSRVSMPPLRQDSIAQPITPPKIIPLLGAMRIPVPNPIPEPNRCNLEPLKPETPKTTLHIVLAQGRLTLQVVWLSLAHFQLPARPPKSPSRRTGEHPGRPWQRQFTSLRK